jgi:hypothetical protein
MVIELVIIITLNYFNLYHNNYTLPSSRQSIGPWQETISIGGMLFNYEVRKD